jgi:hypothetical protein
MSGFNKISQIQPVRSTPTAPLGVRGKSSSTMMWQQPSLTMTPAKRSHLQENHTPAKKSRDFAYSTPMKQGSHHNLQGLNNAPLKRKVTESQRQRPQEESFASRERRTAEEDQVRQEYIDESVEIEADDAYDHLPANQLGLYDGGYDFPAPGKDEVVQDKDGKVAFERVKEETIEMGGFILPGAEKKQIHKSYNWIAGRSDGQYRVVLGYNTLFKPKSKNSIDSSTGEKDSTRWRVVRFENRYKENYPYTEFPAKYLGPLIQALEKARETHDIELKEESVL